MQNATLKERFFAKFEKRSDGCWIWTGANTGRYGQIWYKGRNHVAHRISYQLFIADIYNNLLVCHKCDVTLCVNPDHLFLADMRWNVDDSIRKGRFLACAKLEPDDVRELRLLFRSGMSQPFLAKKYNISQQAISDAVTEKTWKASTLIDRERGK